MILISESKPQRSNRRHRGCWEQWERQQGDARLAHAAAASPQHASSLEDHRSHKVTHNGCPRGAATRRSCRSRVHVQHMSPRLLTTINKQESVMVDTKIFTIYQIVIPDRRQLITS